MSAAAPARMPTPDVLATLRTVLVSRGATVSADIEAASLWLLQAELLGMTRFGLGMLLRELSGLAATTGPGEPIEPTAPTQASAVATVDASGLPGIVALASAVRIALGAAAAHDAGIVGVRDLGATGMIGAAARSIAVTGRIGIVVAESAPFVAPYGGTRPAIGTNPFAIAVPRADGPPLVLDFATAPVTIAELRGRAERGEPLEPGVALDHDGTPTIDPAEVAALLPAGRTASLLGLVVQLLAGVAVGGAATSQREGLFARRGAMVLAFDPPNAETAEACFRLVERWASAGGHVPARLDRLPTRLSELPAELNLDPDTLASLTALAH